MNDPNPYQPSPSAGNLDSGVHSSGVSALVVSHLSRTKPWVQLIGILGIIGSVLAILGSLVVIAGGGAFSTMIASSGKGAAQVPTGLIMVFGLVYLLMGIFMFWLSFKLFSYGSAIGVLRVTGSIQHLELALDRQRSYWKAVGIMVLIVICLYLVAIVVLLGFGATMGSRIQESLEKQRSTMHSSPAKDTESADESTETTPPEDETETK